MKRKILVVDDEAPLTRMVKRNLEATGRYEVAEVNEGLQALRVARGFMPDLVLLDVMMPDIDGGEVAARFAEDPQLKGVPVVFLTAIVSPEEVPPTGRVIGQHTFLAKPIKLDALISSIDKILGVR